MTTIQKVGIRQIKENPNNPRVIKDYYFEKLVQSIRDFPEMLEKRPIVVNKENVILGGNMRFRAAKDAKLQKVPVIVADWPKDKQDEFIIKDNLQSGQWEWESLANEWDPVKLDYWGLDLPGGGFLDPEENTESEPEEKESFEIKITLVDSEQLTQVKRRVKEMLNQFDGAQYQVIEK